MNPMTPIHQAVYATWGVNFIEDIQNIITHRSQSSPFKQSGEKKTKLAARFYYQCIKRFILIKNKNFSNIREHKLL